ncbi:MAG: ABC transporter permease subunit [Gammaproteobacteria bacterium]|nr:ABC transporter permease subunit [Gammaproteobacteria bacterium]NIM72894.1 ABC transporter permease subunit [Gammaproteobacteria bacterium]NIN38505.1 ABC transporter permease subunit [Gammaproteobacteria bacterium]NIO24646.1 ABC transporter permease subunit [Gammaproteobacteria bacterium]NIO65249.1 ABC transporter permease subunit [Gammaproteobacteria bacterium]
MDSWRRTPLVFWILGIPPSVWLIAFFLAPLALVCAFSFGEKRGIVDIAITGTLENYWRALDPLYLQIFAKSFWFAGITTAICLVVAFPIALAITFASPRWKPVLLLIVILPFWTNLLIRTYALIAVLRTRGYVNFGLEWLWDGANGFLSAIGLGELQLLGAQFQPVQMLYNNFAVVFGLVYVYLPFMVLPLYASLDRMDKSYLEASLDLGAGQLRTFLSIVVPLAMPGIISGFIITFIPTLGAFLTPDLLGGTDSQMIANVIERQFKSANDWPFGAALSFLLMYITFFALAIRSVFSRGTSAMEAG